MGASAGMCPHLHRIDPLDHAVLLDLVDGAEHVEAGDTEVGDSEPVGIERRVRRWEDVEALHEVLDMRLEVEGLALGSRFHGSLSYTAKFDGWFDSP